MPPHDWRNNHLRRAYKAARELEAVARQRTANAELPLLTATLTRVEYTRSQFSCFNVSETRRCEDSRNELGWCLFDLDVDEKRQHCLACRRPEMGYGST